MTVAIVQDHIVQVGGAERVLVAMLRAFPDATVYTSFYAPELTYPELRDAHIVTMRMNRIPFLRNHHRAAFPFLARAFGGLRVDAEVVLCSSDGWSHGVNAAGRKVVYCHSPAKWLYRSEHYLGAQRRGARIALQALRPSLVRWDQRAAASAHRYLANSSSVQAAIAKVYGIEAEVLHPPSSFTVHDRAPVPGVPSTFFLSVCRLVPHKNLEAVVRAFSVRPERALVIVGDGPDHDRLRSIAGSNVSFHRRVTDAQLGWLYDRATALVSASNEDFGLTPVEAASVGTPSIVLRWGGFLDTVREGETGTFFDEPSARAIGEAIERFDPSKFRGEVLRSHAEQFSEERFRSRLRAIVAEEKGAAGGSG